MSNTKGERLLQRFTTVSQKLGAQIHLRSLRDGFAAIIPLFILAGLAILINSVVFNPEGFMSNFLDASTIETLQQWGNFVNNGTLNIAALLVAAAISYALATNKNFENPISAVVMALACTFALLPLTTSVVPLNAEQEVDITGVAAFSTIGAQGMFTGIFVGLVGTEIFMKMSKSELLKINLGSGVPPAVSRSFSTMIPAILQVSLFAFIAFLLLAIGNTDFFTIIKYVIQEPLTAINASLPGYLIIVSVANLLFSVGIHQAIVTGSLLDPIFLVNMQENMAAFSNGEEIPNIFNASFHAVFGMMGGTGNTIALLIAILIFSRTKAYREVSKLSAGPGLFNINEPLIFGLPIVFNLPMIIPFILAPIISITSAYLATVWGLIDPFVVMVPWTTPPVISAFLASAGDWRPAVFQLFLIALLVLLYLPFLKVSERVLRLEAEKENKNNEEK